MSAQDVAEAARKSHEEGLLYRAADDKIGQLEAAARPDKEAKA